MGIIRNKKQIIYGSAQHIGRRQGQEDSFGVSDMKLAVQKGFLMIVSDGMGGLSHGNAISSYTVSAMLSMFELFDPAVNIAAQFTHMVTQINERVCAEFTVDGVSGAGATLTAALIIGDMLYWVSVGDSRIYLLRGGRLYQVTEDHDYLNTLFSRHIADDLHLDDAFSDPQKDSLASYIGVKKLEHVDVAERGLSLKQGDKIALVSDGIYNGISTAEWIAVLKNKPQSAADKTIKAVLAKKYPEQDNATIIAAEYN